MSPVGPDAAPFQLLSGTIRTTWNTHRAISEEEDGITVIPSLVSGNTGMLQWLVCWAITLFVRLQTRVTIGS